MTTNISKGATFRKAIKNNQPLQIVGTINAYTSILAEKSGHRAIYLSGGGVAASSMGVPDLGITTLQDVLVDVERITNTTNLPLLVDADTGWGGAFNISRMVKSMISAGAAAIHIEDQVEQKRCGHRPNKELVSVQEMVNRIKAAVDAKTDSEFVVMARTDAIDNEGIESALERVVTYQEAGADAIFAEAVIEIDQYKSFKENLKIPILANITEFGKTPFFTKEELKRVGIDMILYPLSAFRAMSKAAQEVYIEILKKGTQKHIVDKMQTRDELYELLDYHSYEEKLDNLFKS
ncbi:MAG: methylisocitrate lyase [SAR86 cluster bacterium]|nr:methylisocitrate lyase [SAR86 cluster bacterium]|tara:strand:- start:1157 stop:2035 length:879 start_codon:yes stop_codon:yes gene_type:complete